MSLHQSRFANGTLMPEEVDLVQRVYERIAALPWVTQESEKREQLARHVISAFDQGHHDEQDLYEHCLTGARYQFAVLSASLRDNFETPG